jgi:hypothetical protein
VTLPGPSFGLWAVGLLLFAAGSAIVGGAVRTVARRWIPSWRSLGAIERLLLDLYLGGGVVYGLALLPLGLFGPATFPAVLVLAVVVLSVSAVRLGRAAAGAALARGVARFLAAGPLIALLAAGVLGLLELSLAISVPTGNTYDASQLATYTSLLISHHSVPIDLTGVGLALPIAYPQGAAVWMGTAQLLFGLPPARTALLVTPMFLALVPLGAYVVGDRWLGGGRAGPVLAVVFAVLATWTRWQVTGSYDFVLSFPLVLLLIGLSKDWTGPSPVGWSDAVAFGLLAGHAAALSPVGIGWWLLALPVAAGLAPGTRWGGAARRWFARYFAAVAAALVPVSLSLVVVLSGLGHIGFAPTQPGVGTIAPVGLGTPEIVGYVDPFLFGPTAVWLSPFPVLRAELAVLLVAGLLLLILRPAWPRSFPLLPSLAVAGGASALAWFALEGLASDHVRAFELLAPLANGAELAELLSTVYAIVATVPILALLASRPRAPPDPLPEIRRRRRWPDSPSATVTIAVGLLLLVPGIAVTATQFPASEHSVYESFGNVSASDFALLHWAGSHLPAGARVLVAPGSAAEFLVSYAPSVRVLYPMVEGFEYPNTTYRDLLDELTNGTLAPNGTADLNLLDADYIAVTGTNTVLANPFLPAPLLADPNDFSLVFESGDAYLFALATGSGSPPPPAAT